MIRAIRKIVVPLLRLWFGTCRVELINGRVYDEYADLHTPVVVATWHRAAIFALYFFAADEFALILHLGDRLDELNRVDIENILC